MSYAYGVTQIQEENLYKNVIIKVHHRWEDGGFDIVWAKKLDTTYETIENAKQEGIIFCEQNHIPLIFMLEEKEIDQALLDLQNGIDYSEIFQQEIDELHLKYDNPV